jgi:signal-transduction protein with cAMP-binding, CBS, and nucleotidyltransferase domain
MQIADICTRVVQTIGPDASATDAALKMRDAHVGTLVVLDPTRPGSHMAGIVTDRDLTTRILACDRNPQTTPVRDFMTRKVGACHARDGLFDVVQAMHRFGVRRLPVLDDRNQLLGIVSTDDIHGALGRMMDELNQGMLREKLQEADAII